MNSDRAVNDINQRCKKAHPLSALGSKTNPKRVPHDSIPYDVIAKIGSRQRINAKRK
jgi:hypothetical protein